MPTPLRPCNDSSSKLSGWGLLERPRARLWFSPLQRSWRGGGGEDQPAHPNAITPVGAHTFYLPLKGRGLGNPGFPSAQPVLGAAGASTGRGAGNPGFPSAQPVLGAAGASTGRGAGKPGSPVPNRCWGRLAPQQAGMRGNRVSPFPNRCWGRLAPPQAGARGTRVPPCPTGVGGGWRPHRESDGEPRVPCIFTLDVHGRGPQHPMKMVHLCWRLASRSEFP